MPSRPVRRKPGRQLFRKLDGQVELVTFVERPPGPGKTLGGTARTGTGTPAPVADDAATYFHVDPRTLQWTPVAPDPGEAVHTVEPTAIAARSLDGNLHPDPNHRVVLVYDHASGRWSTVTVAVGEAPVEPTAPGHRQVLRRDSAGHIDLVTFTGTPARPDGQDGQAAFQYHSLDGTPGWTAEHLSGPSAVQRVGQIGDGASGSAVLVQDQRTGIWSVVAAQPAPQPSPIGAKHPDGTPMPVAPVAEPTAAYAPSYFHLRGDAEPALHPLHVNGVRAIEIDLADGAVVGSAFLPPTDPSTLTLSPQGDRLLPPSTPSITADRLFTKPGGILHLSARSDGDSGGSGRSGSGQRGPGPATPRRRRGGRTAQVVTEEPAIELQKLPAHPVPHHGDAAPEGNAEGAQQSHSDHDPATTTTTTGLSEQERRQVAQRRLEWLQAVQAPGPTQGDGVQQQDVRQQDVQETHGGSETVEVHVVEVHVVEVPDGDDAVTEVHVVEVQPQPSPDDGPPAQNPPGEHAVGEPIDDIDPALLSSGMPKAGLPHLPQLVDAVRAQANGSIPTNLLEALPQLLLSNYRYLVGDGDQLADGNGGMVLPLGGAELLVWLNPTDARSVPDPGGSIDQPASQQSGQDGDGKAGDPARFRAGQKTDGVFQTGATSSSHSNQTIGYGGAVGANLGAPIPVFKLGGSADFSANAQQRKVGTIHDAEVGRVNDVRGPSQLISFDPRWRFKVRTDPGTSWDSVPAVSVTDGPPQQRLLLWIAEHNLRRATQRKLRGDGQGTAEPGATVPKPPPVRAAPPQLPAVAPTSLTPAQQAAYTSAIESFAGNQRRIPGNFFASGLTGLPELYQRIIDGLDANGVKLPLDSPVRATLLQKLWNLDTHLDKAVNYPVDTEGADVNVTKTGPDGYRFTLSDKGRVLAEVTIKSTRNADEVPRQVGNTSNEDHLEDVRVPIVGGSGGHAFGNGVGGKVVAGFDLVPEHLKLPFEMSLTTYGGVRYSDSNELDAGRAGLGVLVARYTGFTVGYRVTFEHTATVRLSTTPATFTTEAVPGTALLRIPEPDAFSHGFPVNPEALTGDAMAELVKDHTLTYRPDALRGTVPWRGDPDRPLDDPKHDPDPVDVPLPPYARDGNGFGQSLISVDGTAWRQLLAGVVPELQRTGFVPADLDAPFVTSGFDALSVARRDRRMTNLELLYKMISKSALDGYYTQIHQDGMAFTLFYRDGLGKVHNARVTVTASMSGLAEGAPSGFVRRARDHHTVNLAMGMISSGQGTSGGKQGALGVRFSAGPKGSVFKPVGVGVEGRRGISAGNRVNLLSNRPELDEYSGAVDEFRVASTFTIAVEYGDGTGFSHTTPEPVSSAVYLLPFLTAAPAQPQPGTTTDSSVLEQAVMFRVGSKGLTDAARKALPGLTGVGSPNDAFVSQFATNTAVKAGFKEIVNNAYSTDVLSDANLVTNSVAALSIGATLGGSSFLGATPDPYVLGLIKLSLSEAGESSTRSHGIAIDLGGAFQSDVDSGGVASFRSDHGGNWSRGGATTRSQSHTGAEELLQLFFKRAYAFSAPVTYTVKAAQQQSTLGLPYQIRPGTQQVTGSVIFLLSEHEALARYGEGRLPLSEDQLHDAMSRWERGELRLSGTVVANLLTRWHGEALTPDAAADAAPAAAASARARQAAQAGDEARVRWAARLAYLHTNELPLLPADAPDPSTPQMDLRYRVAILDPAALISFRTAFGLTVHQVENPYRHLTMPEYMTRPGPRALGQSGVRTIRFDGGTTLYDQVSSAIDTIAPGLLAKHMQALTFTGGEQVGRLHGSAESLLGQLQPGRVDSLIKNLMHASGMEWYLLNPRGPVSDVVRVTVRLVPESEKLEVVDYVDKAGIEVYSHGYNADGTSASVSTSSGLNAFRFNLTGDTGTSGATGLGIGTGTSRGTSQNVQGVTEQTVYDWNGFYLADLPYRVVIKAVVLNTKGKWFSRTAMAGLRKAKQRSRSQTTALTGTIELMIPQGLAESRPRFGPHHLTDLSPLPRWPGDGYLTAALLDEALPIARRLLAEAFGPHADDEYTRSALSLSTLLSRSHLDNHLPEALTPAGYKLGEDLFIPGRPNQRAELRMYGKLYDLTVLREVKGTGSGRYTKHQSGTTTSHGTNHVSASVPVALGQGEKSDSADPDHPWTPGQDLSTGFDAPSGQGGSSTENYRREQHVKQQGPVYLVELRGTFNLVADLYDHRVLMRTPKSKGDFTSSAITGVVYAELFAGEVEELRRQTRDGNAARADDDPADRRFQRDAPDVDLDRLLADSSGNGMDAFEASRGVPLPGHGTVTLTSSVATRAALTHAALLDWAEPLLPAQRNLLTRWRADFERDRTQPQSQAGIAGWEQRSHDLITLVNAAQPKTAGPQPLPPIVAVLALDPVHVARQTAFALDRSVQVRHTEADGTVVEHVIDPAGRVYRVGADGVPQSSTEAVEHLPAELIPAARWLGAQRLDELYRGSWNHQRTFEQAVLRELNAATSANTLDPGVLGLVSTGYDAAASAQAAQRALDAATTADSHATGSGTADAAQKAAGTAKAAVSAARAALEAARALVTRTEAFADKLMRDAMRMYREATQSQHDGDPDWRRMVEAADVVHRRAVDARGMVTDAQRTMTAARRRERQAAGFDTRWQPKGKGKAVVAGATIAGSSRSRPRFVPAHPVQAPSAVADPSAPEPPGGVSADVPGRPDRAEDAGDEVDPPPRRTPNAVVVVPSTVPGETPQAAQAREQAEFTVAGALLPLPPGSVAVHVHATKDGFRVGDRVLGVREFAGYLLKQKVIDGSVRHVVLIACDTGSGQHPLAEQLLPLLRGQGVEAVVAPRGVAFIAPTLGGRVVAANAGYGADRRPTVAGATPGSWVRFQAGEPGSDGVVPVTATPLAPDGDAPTDALSDALSNVLVTDVPGGFAAPTVDLTDAIFWTSGDPESTHPTALTDVQRHALARAAERGAQRHEADRAAAMERVRRINQRGRTNYPVDDPEAMDRILEAAHRRLQTMPIARNIDLGRAPQDAPHASGRRAPTWAEYLTRHERFPNFWESGYTTGTPFHGGRGWVEEQMGYAPVLNRLTGDPTDVGDMTAQFAPTDPAAMPIYAALVSELQRGGTYGFGSTVLYLKEDVRQRATYTPDDSAATGSAGTQGYTDHEHLYGLLAHGNEHNVRLALGSVTGFRYDPETADDIRRAGYTLVPRYFEAQIHGGMSWHDIAKVTVHWGDLYGSSRATTQQEAEGQVEFLRSFAAEHGYDFTVELGPQIGQPDGLRRAEASRALEMFDADLDDPHVEATISALDRLAKDTPFPSRANREEMLLLAGRAGIRGSDPDERLRHLFDRAHAVIADGGTVKELDDLGLPDDGTPTGDSADDHGPDAVEHLLPVPYGLVVDPRYSPGWLDSARVFERAVGTAMAETVGMRAVAAGLVASAGLVGPPHGDAGSAVEALLAVGDWSADARARVLAVVDTVEFRQRHAALGRAGFPLSAPMPVEDLVAVASVLLAVRETEQSRPPVGPGERSWPARATELMFSWALSTGRLSAGEVALAATVAGIPIAGTLVTAAPVLHTFLARLAGDYLGPDAMADGDLRPPHLDRAVALFEQLQATQRGWADPGQGMRQNVPSEHDAYGLPEARLLHAAAVSVSRAVPSSGLGQMFKRLLGSSTYFTDARVEALDAMRSVIGQEGGQPALLFHPAYTLPLFAYTADEFDLMEPYLANTHLPVAEQVERLTAVAVTMAKSNATLPFLLRNYARVAFTVAAVRRGGAGAPTDAELTAVLGAAVRHVLPLLDLRIRLLNEMLDHLPRTAQPVFHGWEPQTQRTTLEWWVANVLRERLIRQHSYQSNSTNRDVAVRFARATVKRMWHRLPVVIRVNGGARPIQALSNWQGEGEALLPAGSALRVLKFRLKLRNGIRYWLIDTQVVPSGTPGSWFLTGGVTGPSSS